jgi:hypothetical protein
MESWIELFGDRGTAENVTAFEDDYAAARPGEIGGADETIVATTNDSHVIAAATARVFAAHPRFLAGLKKGG